MSLILKSVEASRGPHWVAEAFRLFARKPLAFTMLALPFMAVAALLQLLPPPLNLLPVMVIPLLSLGFMVAGQAVLKGGSADASHFVGLLRGEPRRRRALLQLSLGYGVAVGLIVLLAHLLSGPAWVRLSELASKGEVPLADLQALAPSLTAGMLVLGTFGTVLSFVYWHAPALVHWGGQSAMQSLFSSGLAAWRSKGALFTYSMAWVAAVIGIGLVMGLIGGALGSPQFAQFLSMVTALVLTAIFYLSVLFTFNDTFGSNDQP